MKKLLTFFVSLIFGVALALPEDGLYDLSDNRATERELSKGHLEVPQFSFVHGPDTLMTTYYDYMIGGYNNSALATIPESHGGGYFCTFHARPTRYGIRSVYWAYINCNGVLEQSGMFPGENIAGYPALALDQEGANPLYVWHTNGDTDDDLEVMFAYDRMLNGVPGNLTEPVILIDNPVEIGSTTDNEFIWPEICIGPSPNPSMRRLYIAAKNITRHGDQPSENVLIKYADFDSQMLQNGSELVWSSSSIPVLDAWNQDLVINRRPFLSMSADNLGNLYYIGYHYAMDIDSEVIPEADMDVFVCPNYGEGEWTHHSFDSTLDCWIPVYDDPIWRDGDENDDEEWMWKIANSGHFNSMVDNNGRVRALGLWPLFIPNSYQLNLHTVKCYSFNPQDISMQIKEVYPKGNPENVAYPHFIPWDVQPPWGEVDEWALSGDEYYPVLQQTIFPFPYWDETAITDAMIFHYNHLMLTKVNSENMMVALWQDSQRARHAWLEPDVYPEDLAYQNSPEIVIATSADGGVSWSDPIYLNDVDNPELAGLRPMWVYPADKVKYVGMQGGRKVGCLGLLFVDDTEWGAASVFNNHVLPDTCMVMHAELEIVFPEPVTNDDPYYSSPALNLIKNAYPNPFKDALTISVALKDNEEDFSLGIYNIRGQKIFSHTDRAKGEFELQWAGLDGAGKRVPAGIYLLRLECGDKRQSRKIIRF